MLGFGKKRRDFILGRLRREYGTGPNPEYRANVFRETAEYFHEKHRCEDEIDDITWNDIEGDDVFERINYSHCSAGMEVLYHLLRTPEKEKEVLEKRNKLISFLNEKDAEREKLLMHLYEIGYTGKYSLFEYLDYLDRLKERKNLPKILMDLLYIPLIGMFFIDPAVGVLSLFVLIAVQISVYYKEKAEVNPYLISFAYILRVIRGAEKICHDSFPEMEEEMTQIQRELDELKHFSRFSGIAMSLNDPMGASGNPLDLLFDYLKIMLHIDLMKFNQMLFEVKKQKAHIDRLVTAVGYLDACACIAYYRASLDVFSVPEFEKGKKNIEGINMYHPLLEEPVKNSICAQKGVLVTGSNASGKSTFLKTVAINALFAQTIMTCTADSFRTDYFVILSSMSLRDNLGDGESYFIVEIKALKRILDTVRSGKNVICFTDEVLRGTNTVERIAAASTILKELSAEGALCFAATHDIELTGILESVYDNYHFTERIEEGDIHFDYLLKKGRATTRNAIKLLSVMGFGEEIIDEAGKLAEKFVETGEWI